LQKTIIKRSKKYIARIIRTKIINIAKIIKVRKKNKIEE